MEFKMLFRTITNIKDGFCSGWKSASHTIDCSKVVKKDKGVRDNLSESQIDKMLKDTFPASDPVTMY